MGSRIYVLLDCEVDGCIVLGAYSSVEKAMEAARKVHERTRREHERTVEELKKKAFQGDAVAKARLGLVKDKIIPEFRVRECSFDHIHKLCVDLVAFIVRGKPVTVEWLEIVDVELDAEPRRF